MRDRLSAEPPCLSDSETFKAAELGHYLIVTHSAKTSTAVPQGRHVLGRGNRIDRSLRDHFSRLWLATADHGHGWFRTSGFSQIANRKSQARFATAIYFTTRRLP
jgi:hypothetical protein